MKEESNYLKFIGLCDTLNGNINKASSYFNECKNNNDEQLINILKDILEYKNIKEKYNKIPIDKIDINILNELKIENDKLEKELNKLKLRIEYLDKINNKKENKINLINILFKNNKKQGKDKNTIFDNDLYNLTKEEKKLVNDGNYDPWNFDEENIEEDDYHYDDE